MKKTTSTRRRDTGGRFISDIEHLLGQFRPALESAQGRSSEIDDELRRFYGQRDALLRQKLGELMPDLETMTIARLKVKCPGFVTRSVQQAIDQAHTVRVPFWTSVFGGSAAYRTSAVAEQLKLVRVQLKKWVDGQQPRPESFAEVTEIESKIAVLESEKRELRKKISQLETQVSGLEAQQRRYSDPRAPEPPADLRDAVTKSADGMRSAQQSAPAGASTTTIVQGSSGSNGISFTDYLILDTLFHHNDRTVVEHHYHDRNPDDGGGSRSPTPSSSWDRGTPDQPAERSPRFGGGSVEVRGDEETGRFGGGSVRMSADDNAGERFGGGSRSLGNLS